MRRRRTLEAGSVTACFSCHQLHSEGTPDWIPERVEGSPDGPKACPKRARNRIPLGAPLTRGAWRTTFFTLFGAKKLSANVGKSPANSKFRRRCGNVPENASQTSEKALPTQFRLFEEITVSGAPCSSGSIDRHRAAPTPPGSASQEMLVLAGQKTGTRPHQDRGRRYDLIRKGPRRYLELQ